MTHFDWHMFTDQALGFLVGACLGAIAGYLRGIKKVVNETMVKVDHLEHRNESGALSFPSLQGLGMVVVIVITVYAAFMSQVASNKVSDAQGIRDRENLCTTNVLFSTVEALNARTSLTVDQAKANAVLQKAQLRFIRILVDPNAEPGASIKELQEYFTALEKFVKIVDQAVNTYQDYPYPTEQSYTRCLNRAQLDPTQAEEK
jgi:hypothetical protein